MGAKIKKMVMKAMKTMKMVVKKRPSADAIVAAVAGDTSGKEADPPVPLAVSKMLSDPKTRRAAYDRHETAIDNIKDPETKDKVTAIVARAKGLSACSKYVGKQNVINIIIQIKML